MKMRFIHCPPTTPLKSAYSGQSKWLKQIFLVNQSNNSTYFELFQKKVDLKPLCGTLTNSWNFNNNKLHSNCMTFLYLAVNG